MRASAKAPRAGLEFRGCLLQNSGGSGIKPRILGSGLRVESSGCGFRDRKDL